MNNTTTYARHRIEDINRFRSAGYRMVDNPVSPHLMLESFLGCLLFGTLSKMKTFSRGNIIHIGIDSRMLDICDTCYCEASIFFDVHTRLMTIVDRVVNFEITARPSKAFLAWEHALKARLPSAKEDQRKISLAVNKF